MNKVQMALACAYLPLYPNQPHRVKSQEDIKRNNTTTPSLCFSFFSSSFLEPGIPEDLGRLAAKKDRYEEDMDGGGEGIMIIGLPFQAGQVRIGSFGWKGGRRETSMMPIAE